jgi:hypothetical protein
METSNLTISVQGDAMREFCLPALASRPGLARIVEPTHARIAQMLVNPSNWPSAGIMPAQPAAAQQHQGGALAGLGKWDVTDTTFSTRVGPPSCSPPV